MTTYTHDTLTQKHVDAADLWSTDADYGANEQFSIVVPGTPTFTTLDGIDLTPGRQVNLAYPVARTAAETAATFDAAEALLANYVGEAGAVLDQPLPTSLANLGNWAGQNLQNAVTNGVMIGAGTGPAGTGAPHSAWTGAMRVRRIGDYVEQQFHTSNAPGTAVGEIFWRESYNGGATWTAWLGQ